MMVSRKKQKQMLEYLIAKLDSEGESINPYSKELVSGIISNYISIGKNKLLFLVDKTYPNQALKKINNSIRQFRKDVAYVLLKDGTIFFRNAAEKKYFKKSKNFSLKNYSNEDMHKMIMFRPEETFLTNIRNNILQYYQPDSPRLKQGIVSFKFKPVYFDYSHIDSNLKFKPENKNSAKLNIWIKRIENYNNFQIKNNFLIDIN